MNIRLVLRISCLFSLVSCLLKLIHEAQYLKFVVLDQNMRNNVNSALYTELQEKKLLIKQMQPPTFRGEGTGLEKAAESWIKQMDDYFTTAGTVASNKAMLGMFKLAGETKLWWKQNCKDRGVSEVSQTWEDIKTAVKERYLPPGGTRV